MNTPPPPDDEAALAAQNDRDFALLSALYPYISKYVSTRARDDEGLYITDNPALIAARRANTQREHEPDSQFALVPVPLEALRERAATLKARNLPAAFTPAPNSVWALLHIGGRAVVAHAQLAQLGPPMFAVDLAGSPADDRPHMGLLTARVGSLLAHLAPRRDPFAAMLYGPDVTGVPDLVTHYEGINNLLALAHATDRDGSPLRVGPPTGAGFDVVVCTAGSYEKFRVALPQAPLAVRTHGPAGEPLPGYAPTLPPPPMPDPPAARAGRPRLSARPPSLSAPPLPPQNAPGPKGVN